MISRSSQARRWPPVANTCGLCRPPAGALPTPGVNETKKSRAVVKPAANFQIKDGVNVVCFASHRKTAVAISPMCGDRGHELPHR